MLKTLQVKRNREICSSRDEAIGKLKDLSLKDGGLQDGEIVLCRYELDGEIQTLIGAGYVNENGEVKFSYVDSFQEVVDSGIGIDSIGAGLTLNDDGQINVKVKDDGYLKINDNRELTIEEMGADVTKIKDSIKVAGVTVGNVNGNTPAWESGTSIETILKAILCKTISLTTSSPTIKINVQNVSTTNVEVGTIIKPKISIITTDGQFKSSDMNAWNFAQNAGCSVSDYKIYRGDTKISEENTYEDEYTFTKKESIIYKATCDFGEVTKTLTNNTGGEETLTIDALNDKSSTGYTINSYYKYFISGISPNDEINEETIKNNTKSSGLITGDSVTIASLTFEPGKFIFACPPGYKLKQIKNSLGADINISEVFEETTIEISCADNDNVKFVYTIYDNKGTDKVEYQNIIIGK